MGETVEKLAILPEGATSAKPELIIRPAVDRFGIFTTTVEAIAVWVSWWDLTNILGTVEPGGDVVGLVGTALTDRLVSATARIRDSVLDVRSVLVAIPPNRIRDAPQWRECSRVVP